MLRRPGPEEPADTVSPWRAARPRRHLSEFKANTPGRPESPPNNSHKESPPNSSNKESTRLESPALERAGSVQATSASPLLALDKDKSTNRSQTKGRSARDSYTKLRNRSVKKSRSRSRSDEDTEEGDETEQPAARCKFVGNSSQAGRGLADSVTEASGLREASTKGWSPGLCLSLLFAFALGLVALQADLSVGPGLQPEPLSAAHWKAMRGLVRDEVTQLKTLLPNQTGPGFWTVVSAALKAPLHALPDYPGVLVLLAPPGARPTAHCLALRLTALASRALARPGLLPPPLPALTLPAANLPSHPPAAKEQLTAQLHAALASGGAVALLRLDLLNPVAALTLHAFTDNSNAPYKQAVLVATLEVAEGAAGGCKLEQLAERALGDLWGAELGPDKLAALLSRLVVSVVEVQEEALGQGVCPQ